MNEKNNIVQFPPKPLTNHVTCALCGSSKVSTKWLTDSFEYGSDDVPVKLEVDIPVYNCTECSFEFTNHSADVMRHEAVCRHLGLLTPAEVRAVRKNMSKAEFSRQTGIGEASLNRWEKGALLQNVAMDNFLYLLILPGNFEALQERNDNPEFMVSMTSTFRVIKASDDRLIQKAANFRL